MTSLGYRLTDGAEADLRGIIRHTRKQWGNVQVRRYITVGMQAGAAYRGAAQREHFSEAELLPS